MTKISNIELVTQNNKNKNLNITYITKKEKDCTIKLNITIKGDSNHKIQNYHTNLTFSNKTIDLKPDIKFSNKYFNTSNDTNFDSYNLNLKNNSFKYNSQIEVSYSLCNPKQDQLDELATYMLRLKSNKTKESLCFSCLDNFNFLVGLLEEIKNIKQDLKLFKTDKNTKQDLIIKFSDYINKINLIKIELFKLTNLIELQKRVNCSIYESNNCKFQAAFRKTNHLIEVIQDAIRKQNLNVNFIVIN